MFRFALALKQSTGDAAKRRLVFAAIKSKDGLRGLATKAFVPIAVLPFQRPRLFSSGLYSHRFLSAALQVAPAECALWSHGRNSSCASVSTISSSPTRRLLPTDRWAGGPHKR